MEGTFLPETSNPQARFLCGWLGGLVLLTAMFGTPVDGGALPAASNGAEPLERYRVAIGFRSQLSGGSQPLEKLVQEAKAVGFDGVLLADNLSRQLQYGLPPLRYLLWFSVRKPSVSTMGPARYIETVRAVNERQKSVCLIPGVRVTPGYYWTGSVWGDLKCHDFHREILMLGTTESAALSRLSYSAGFVPGRDGLWIFASRFLLLLLTALGVGYFHIPMWIGHRYRMRHEKARRLYSICLIAPVVLLTVLFNIGAGEIGRFHIHGPSPGMNVEQRVLDEGAAAGFFQIWSQPQTSVEVYRRPVTFSTQKYGQAISLTHNYNGFSCFSVSGTDIYAAGGVWDRQLRDYIKCAAPYPILAVGDLLDPRSIGNSRIGIVDNIVRARGKTPELLLEALGKGRFYCRRRSASNAIDFTHFSVDGYSFGEHGRTTRNRINVEFEVSSLEIGTPVAVELIRNGTVLHTFKGATLFAKRITDTIDRRMENMYYRITVRGPDRLAAVGQPVFLFRASPGRTSEKKNLSTSKSPSEKGV